MYAFYEAWQTQSISNQTCALYFFIHDYLRKYPNKKLAQYYQDSYVLSQNSWSLSSEVLYQFNFKKVKGKAIDALYAYCNHQWNCQLFTRTLMPLEVLSLQASGIRPLSMIKQLEFGEIGHKSDCFEFFVHDLEHAYMFFFDEDRFQQQCCFFKRILTSIAEGVWDDLLEDDYFKEKFEYLMSDMNSHIQHYYFYLKAIVPLGTFKHYDYLFDGLL